MTTEFPPTDKPEAGYLLKLELENIRCFAAKQTLDLCAPGTTDRPARWTIILGENGTGKTTLLQALIGPLPDRWTDEASPTADRIFNSPGVPGRIVDEMRRKGVEAGWLEVTASSFAAPFGLNIEEDGTASSALWREVLGRMPPILAYGALRRVNELPQRELQASRGYETLFSEVSGLPDPAEWLREVYALTTLPGEEARAATRYERVVSLLREERLFPLVRDVKVVQQASGAVEALFVTDFGDVTIHELSAGYRAMSAWVVDVAAHMFNAYPESATPLNEAAIVIVDEFDLHLHPIWQRGAIEFLESHFPGVQFIVTAHSPLVVQSVPGANVVVLEKVEDHVTIKNDPVSVETWRVDQILTSELFGLKSARPPDIDVKRRRLEALLLTAKRTPEQEEEFKRLDRELDEIAIGYNAEHIEAFDFIKRVADEMKEGKEP